MKLNFNSLWKHDKMIALKFHIKTVVNYITMRLFVVTANKKTVALIANFSQKATDRDILYKRKIEVLP